MSWRNGIFYIILQSGDTTERLDHGVLTRAKRKELGLDADCLSSTVGCRKPDKITTR